MNMRLRLVLPLSGLLLCLMAAFLPFTEVRAQLISDAPADTASAESFPEAYFNPPPAVQAASASQAGQEAAAEDESEELQISDNLTTGELRELLSFGKIFTALLLLLLIFGLTKSVNFLLETLAERFSNYRLLLKRFIPVLRLLIWAIGLYIVISAVFNPPIETVITISASIGIAIGFASQDILRNVFGGLMIILDRPFQVGDKIDIGGHYGEVTEIGLRSVRLTTPDDSMVSVPNGELMNKAVSNTNSSALDCQVVCDVFLPTDVDIQQMRRLGRRAAVTSRYVYLNKPIVINILNETRANRSFIILRVKAYVLDIRHEFRFKSDVTELIMQELGEQGIHAPGG